MPSFWRKQAQRHFLSACFFSLLIVLTACSGSGTTHPPSRSVGQRVAPSSSTPVGALKTYTGTTFSISYPRNWQVQGSGNQVIFQDAQGLNALTMIVTPNPGGLKSANDLASTTFPAVEKAILTSPQPTNISPTVTVAGEPWIQRGASGTLSTGGQSVAGTLILLMANHPATSPTTQVYEIYYGGPTATFDQMDRTAFQMMLQSLKLTASRLP